MAEFGTTLTANTDTRPVYEVTVNNGGQDGGSNAYLMVGGFPASMDYVAADAAVQALADTYATAAGYTVVGIKRLTVAETTL